MAGGENMTTFTCADEVADEGTVGGGEGGNGHEEEGGDAADDVGDGEGAFTKVLDGDEEEEPGAGGNEVLYHGPNGDIENAAEEVALEMETWLEGVATPGDTMANVEGEEEDGDGLGDGGGDGGTRDAKGRETAFAENEKIVEDDVGGDHDKRIEGEDAGLGGGDKEGAEHGTDESKEEAVDTPAQVVVGGGENGGGVNEVAKEVRRDEAGEREYEGSE